MGGVGRRGGGGGGSFRVAGFGPKDPVFGCAARFSLRYPGNSGQKRVENGSSRPKGTGTWKVGRRGREASNRARPGTTPRLETLTWFGIVQPLTRNPDLGGEPDDAKTPKYLAPSDVGVTSGSSGLPLRSSAASRHWRARSLLMR